MSRQDRAPDPRPREGPEPGPINLQDHNSEVRYRNVWFVEKP